MYRGNWKANYPTMMDDDFLEVDAFVNFQFLNIFGEDLHWIWDEHRNVFFGETSDQLKYQGKGVCRYSPGYLYRGFFKDNMWSQRGELFNKDGLLYKGQFFENRLEGQGTMFFPDKRKYVGQFQKGEMEGQGNMLFPDGKVITGLYKQSLLEGEAVITYPDTSSLECEYKAGVIQGTAFYVKRGKDSERFFIREYEDGEIVSQRQTKKRSSKKKRFCCFF